MVQWITGQAVVVNVTGRFGHIDCG